MPLSLLSSTYFLSLHIHCGQVEGIIDRELQIARQLIAQKKRDRALLFLKRKKIQEQQVERLDAWLINVEQLVGPFFPPH